MSSEAEEFPDTLAGLVPLTDYEIMYGHRLIENCALAYHRSDNTPCEFLYFTDSQVSSLKEATMEAGKRHPAREVSIAFREGKLRKFLSQN